MDRMSVDERATCNRTTSRVRPRRSLCASSRGSSPTLSLILCRCYCFSFLPIPGISCSHFCLPIPVRLSNADAMPNSCRHPCEGCRRALSGSSAFQSPSRRL
ncbi:hypothetical protein VTK73DRAFT_6243 [Phialemonium thermophilum]|uniref:Uncharacterized protein n=1 Tax=Phialemonium thermophilum TaxID=223376 RepID=A0ABR3UZZ4_9PEZI